MTVKCPVRGDNVFYRPQSFVRGNWHYHVTDAYVHSKEETAEIGNEILQARELFTGDHDEAMTKDASEESR